MTPRFIRFIKICVVVLCAGLLAVSAAMFLRAQTSPSLANLREQLRARYNIVALQDELALVPRQRNGDIKIVEIRDGAVAINGSAITAREARDRLGKDADLIFRVTYLDAAAQRELARPDSAGTAPQANPQENSNQPEPAAPERTQVRRGNVVRIGGGVTVGRDEVVEGDVVAIGGSADIDGEVTHSVTVVGGSLNLGPDAIVREDVTVVGGALNRSAGARIDGKVDDVGFGPGFSVSQSAARELPRRRFQFQSTYSRVGSFFITLLRMTLLILFALVVMVLGRRFVEAIAARTAAEPLRSGLAGLLAEVLFVPLVVVTVVVLAVSIIGIPLLFLVPFAVVLAVVLMIVGFTGVASVVGRLISDRFGIKKNPYVSVALGVLVVVGVTLIAKLCALVGGLVFGVVVADALAAVGYLAEYIAWTIGIGAVILTWLGNRRRGAPTAPVVGPVPGAAPAA